MKQKTPIKIMKYPKRKLIVTSTFSVTFANKTKNPNWNQYDTNKKENVKIQLRNGNNCVIN